MKKHVNGAILSWSRADFIENNQEIPDSLLMDDIHTEGELMSKEDILLWLEDTSRTFSILKESNSELYKNLLSGFVADIEYLQKIKKITGKEADILLGNEEDKE